MSLGVLLKGLNYHNQGKRVDCWFEFVPQIVMLLSLFGLMDLLIIVKWLTDFSQLPPPSIIATMISMGLNFGHSQETKLIWGQTTLMQILLVIILICVPLMLLVKPLH